MIGHQKLTNIDMKIIREFTCSMTGDVCLIVADKNGDEMCILKEDYYD